MQGGAEEGSQRDQAAAQAGAEAALGGGPPRALAEASRERENTGGGELVQLVTAKPTVSSGQPPQLHSPVVTISNLDCPA